MFVFVSAHHNDWIVPYTQASSSHVSRLNLTQQTVDDELS